MPTHDTLQKDTYSINEMFALNRLLQSTNEFILDNADDDIHIVAVTVTMQDAAGRLVGTLTKWTKTEDVKFEPNFEADLA